MFGKAKSAVERHVSQLGLKVKDRVTGFEGVVSTMSFDLYGCIQAAVTPAAKDGTIELMMPFKTADAAFQWLGGRSALRDLLLSQSMSFAERRRILQSFGDIA